MSEPKRISVFELKELIDSAKEHFLIDVRNPQEYDICNITANLIPMNEIPSRIEEIPKDTMVVIHCHHGGRSKRVIQWLEANYQFDNLYNLDGGIDAWSSEIDPNIPRY
jgi:sulfur-carrier protein adenylyltransferase/sulfurtransferase